jgi:RimJ/RimL family protein N-acetyltransferase
MQIIPYQDTDTEAVASLFRKIFLEMGWEEHLSDHMDTPHVLFHLPDKGILLIAKDGETVVGTAGIILLSETEGLIKRFYLENTYRGSGIAQELLDELTRSAASLGVKKLFLDVRRNNSRAIGFYKKNGFQLTSVTPRTDWPESNTPEIRYFFHKTIDEKL